MAVLPTYHLPVTFSVPADVWTGIASGELIRHNGVVRNRAGEIIFHLKEVLPSGSQPSNSMTRVAQPINAKLVLGTLAVVAVISGGTALVWRRKRQKAAAAQAASCSTTYDDSLVLYLAAIKNQTLDQKVIDQLIAALDDVLEIAGMGDVEIVVAPEGVAEMVAVVADYTRVLADANEQPQPTIDQDESTSPLSPVIELRQYLMAQRTILERAA